MRGEPNLGIHLVLGGYTINQKEEYDGNCPSHGGGGGRRGGFEEGVPVVFLFLF